jgi:tetratricopeptide (TPR) repeat protein
VQLVEGATDRHIWADSYEVVITGPKDIFRIQSEIAKSIAAELQAVITPAEKELIERIPTKNLTAFDFYTRGRNEVWKFWSTGDTPALDRAEDLFNAALEYDASYGEAYSGLALVYWNKHYWEDYYTDHFLDSVLILARKALDYDNQISEAYVIMGNYYREMGQIEEAEEAFNKALQLNPNDWMAYWSKGMMYFHIDHVKYMKNLQRAILYNRGSTLPTNLRAIGSSYANAGFFKKCLHFLNEALKLDGDSILFLQALASNEENRGNYEEAIILNHKILSMDSSNINALSSLAYEYSFIGKFEESVYFYSMWDRNRTELNNPYYGGLQRRGYAYYKIGKVNEAESYFNMQMEYSNTAISLDRLQARNLWPYYNLAGLFAFEGDRIKAYENLKIFNRRNMMPLWMVTLINDDPMFDNIRNEPEFQQIVRDVEAKYQAEHERVRQWLEENDML